MKKKLLAVAASIFLIAGCSKHNADASTEAPGQTFNAVQFCQDFASAPAEQKTPADKAWVSVQSGAFPAALQCLRKLEADPALSAAQKKSVADLAEQVKKQMAASTNAR